MALVDRVKNILLTPRTEWQVIDAEPATVSSLYAGYIAPLAAIPAVCAALGMALIGINIPFVGYHYRAPLASALMNAVVSYVLSLVAVYVMALIIDALAPTFAGTKSPVQALKVVAYSYTASWVGGVFALIPGLRWLTILFSLYSLYLLFLALPVLMKSPADRALGYTVVVIICAILVAWVVFFAVGALGFGLTGGPMAMPGTSTVP